MGRIEKMGQIMVPFHGLQQEQDCRYQKRLVAPVACEEQHQTDHDKQQQHIACREKSRIERGKTGQQEQAPQKAIAEILSLLLLVMSLNMEGKAEQQGEYGVCLSGKKGKDTVENALIQRL